MRISKKITAILVSSLVMISMVGCAPKESATLQSTEDNKEDTSNSDRYFIVEDNEYKLLWHDDFKEHFSSNYVYVAWMEIHKKENKDLNKAAIDIKKALEIDSENSHAYYALACVYSDLKRYDEALNAADKYLEYLDKNDEYYKSISSDTYNLKGVIYMDKEDFSKAKEYYNKALELNPNNEYAKLI